MTARSLSRQAVLCVSATASPVSLTLCAVVWTAAMLLTAAELHAAPLPQPQDSITEPTNTEPLTVTGDIALQMVEGIDQFLLREIARSAAARPANWQLNQSSAAAFEESVTPHRQRLARQIGAHDPRLPFDAPQVTSPVNTVAELGQSNLVRILPVRWPVLSDPSPQGQGLPSTFGEGLLVMPKSAVVADVVVIPDADQTPEQLAGLDPGFPSHQQTARILANLGFRVVVPQLISRERAKRNGRANLTNREYLHRPAFELGRTLAGYELQSILSIVDWFQKSGEARPIAVAGYGEGGMLALFAAALDSRIRVTLVAGFFGPREESWKEPIDRNFAGLLQHAGAGELAMMVAPRTLIIDLTPGPQITLSGDGGAPAELSGPDPHAAQTLLDDARTRLTDLAASTGRPIEFISKPDTIEALRYFCKTQGITFPATKTDVAVTSLAPASDPSYSEFSKRREHRLLMEYDRHSQALLRESPFTREAFMAKLDTSSVEKYSASVEAYRDVFRRDVIGHFDEPLLPFNARSRKSWQTESWTGHEVMLEVFPDVFAYGVLLLPKDLKAGEKRPVVVCQHGLEGRPTDIFLNDHPAYHDFAAKLCERGFITFSPQNPYIFTDKFRTLQRKAQPLGKSLFSVIVPQHQQIVNWLKSQPFTDPDRIAFYGLSYGGKSAMRIPALVTDYCLSICSADFNEWVLKNASTRHNFSYVWTGEYEIFEWDLGSTFNYAEMAALICPRPFMVERGHFDGVGLDEYVGHEYAKVQFLYAGKLKIADRTEIEWFDGPHTINGKGTYQFLHKHLNWPAPAEN